jgi:hypothetical protein
MRKSSLTFKKSGGAAGPSDPGSGGETVMAAATELATVAGIRAVCPALALPRASYYRKLHPDSSASPISRRPPARALRPEKRQTVLVCLHEERFQDRSPPEVKETPFLKSKRKMPVYDFLDVTPRRRRAIYWIRHN